MGGDTLWHNGRIHDSGTGSGTSVYFGKSQGIHTHKFVRNIGIIGNNFPNTLGVLSQYCKMQFTQAIPM